ncbi:MAG: hypothetical protein Q8878_06225, partial [Bacillota bacterium]|nr:hypothetical protein [Bacillota bacterium]
MKWKEPLKSVILVLLIFLSLFIYTFNWVYRMDRGQLARGTGFATRFAYFFGITRNVDQSALSMEVTPAAVPLRAAARVDGGLFGVLYDQKGTEDFYERIKPVLSEALENSPSAGQADAKEYKKALSGTMAYLGFDGEIPFYALSEWVGAPAGGYDFPARHVVIADENGTLTLYVRGRGASDIRKIKTEVQGSALKKALSGLKPNGCYFAFEKGGEYKNIETETIISDKSPGINYVLSITPNFKEGSDATQTVLEAFSFNPYNTESYTEKDGTEVYVENLSTLRIGKDGTIHFIVSDLSAGIPVSGVLTGDSGPAARVRTIEAARFLFDHVSSGLRSDASIYLRSYRIDAEKQSFVLNFGMQVSGVPVNGKGGPAAQIEIKNGVICAATLYLRSYRKTDGECYLMPIKQAVSAYPPGAERGGAIWARYDGSGENPIAASYY